MLFMRTFIFNAHDAARLMKANLEHDHYQAASVATVQEDLKQLWQGVTVSHPCLLKTNYDALFCALSACLGSDPIPSKCCKYGLVTVKVARFPTC